MLTGWRSNSGMIQQMYSLCLSLKSKLVCKYLKYCFEMPVLLTGTVHSGLIKLANGCTL